MTDYVVSIEGMTPKRWQQLSETQRRASRDLSGLTRQLVGLEGYRVEVIDQDGERRRFIVGRSTGWRPCHLEIKTIRSHGGIPAAPSYKRVATLRRVR